MSSLDTEKSIAYSAFAKKEYQTAKEKFGSILIQYKGSIDDRSYHLLACDYATSMLFLGEFTEAIRLFKENIDFFSEIGDEHQTGLVHGNLATAYEMYHQYGEAEKEYESALKLMNQESSPQEYFLCLKSLSLMRFRTGKVNQAVWTYTRAIEAKPHPTIFDKIFLWLLSKVFK